MLDYGVCITEAYTHKFRVSSGRIDTGKVMGKRATVPGDTSRNRIAISPRNTEAEARRIRDLRRPGDLSQRVPLLLCLLCARAVFVIVVERSRGPVPAVPERRPDSGSSKGRQRGPKRSEHLCELDGGQLRVRPSVSFDLLQVEDEARDEDRGDPAGQDMHT